jgi:tetratricopeptide (TPR) repeat protein
MKKFTILMALMFSFLMITNAQTSKRNAARISLDNGDIAKAKELIDAAITHEKTIEDAKTWLYYGMIYSKIGASTDEAIKSLDTEALDKALDAYAKSVNLDPKKLLYLELSTNVLQLANTFYAKGYGSFESEIYDEAIDLFDKAGKANAVISVVDTMTIYAAALSASHGGINTTAIEKYTQLIDMGFNNASIYSDLANVFKKEDNFAKAEEILALGREKFPQDNGILIAEINLLLGQRKFEEVISKLKRSIELEPENANLYLALGDSYKEIGDTDEAINYYQKSLEINPDYFLALYNLGVVYYSHAFDLNMEANNLPFDATAQYKKIMTEANEYFLKGLPYFERAYKVDSGDPDVLKALRQIYTSTQQLDKLKKLNEM